MSKQWKSTTYLEDGTSQTREFVGPELTLQDLGGLRELERRRDLESPASSPQTAVVMGMDWDDNPVERELRPGFEVALRGEFGKGFDIRGPQAWMCQECNHVLTVERAGQMICAIQDHYYTTHGYTPALLP